MTAILEYLEQLKVAVPIIQPKFQQRPGEITVHLANHKPFFSGHVKQLTRTVTGVYQDEESITRKPRGHRGKDRQI